MTNAKHTLLAFLIDRSGSMQSIREDTEGGLRAFVEEQLSTLQEGETIEAWLRQFDQAYEAVFTREPLEKIAEYRLTPRGMTALVDALAFLIREVGEDLAARPEEERPGRVMVVTLTDGMENSSREVTADALKVLVKEQEERYSWDFIFLGANLDAVAVGAQYGFSAGKSLQYGANSAGVQATFRSVGRYVSEARMAAPEALEDLAFSEEEREEAMGEG